MVSTSTTAVSANCLLSENNNRSSNRESHTVASASGLLMHFACRRSLLCIGSDALLSPCTDVAEMSKCVRFSCTSGTLRFKAASFSKQCQRKLSYPQADESTRNQTPFLYVYLGKEGGGGIAQSVMCWAGCPAIHVLDGWVPATETHPACTACNEWHSFHARVGRFSPFLYLRSVAIAVILFWLQLVVLVSPCFLGPRIPRDYRFPPAPLFLCSERKPSSLTTGSSKLQFGDRQTRVKTVHYSEDRNSRCDAT